MYQFMIMPTACQLQAAKTLCPLSRKVTESDPREHEASESKVHVNIPWLKNCKVPADKDGHPLTGSSQHFAFNDVFHQGNSKDQTF